MKRAPKRMLSYVIAAMLLIFMTAPAAQATDGYFSNGYGTVNKGFAGAGIAYVKGPFGGVVNPAGIAFLEKKWSFEVSVGIFNPNRKYTIIGAPTQDPRAFGLAEGTVESDKKTFIVPTVAFTYKVADKHTLGFNFWGNGGMNTTYETKTYYSEVIAAIPNEMFPTGQNPMNNVSQPTGVNLQQMFASLTYAFQMGAHSLAVSPMFAYQTFEATGLEAFRDMGMAGGPGLPVDRSQYVTNNGTDNATGFGVKIGYQGEIVSGLRLGASYQPKIKMSKFDKYAGLFAEEGGFDIPSSWQAGVSYTFADDYTVLFDVKQIFYSTVKSIANPMVASQMSPMNPDLTPNENWVPLGDENGAGFGWQDMTIFKIGFEAAPIETWAFRAGFSYGDQPIPDSEVMFNIMAPGVNTTHVSLGFTKEIKDHALNFAVTHALNNKVSGTNPFDPAQTIELEMNQWEFELGFRF